MNNSIIRATIDALLPPGVLWKPEPGESFEQQLDGIADTIDDIKNTINGLKHIRNPHKTPIFTDLERNFGFLPNENIEKSNREKRLARRIYKKARTNAIQDLQDDLTFSGFDLLVHQNDPPIDPSTFFIDEVFQMTASSDYAFAGYNEGADILSYAGAYSSELIVNTPIRIQEMQVTMQAGGAQAYAGYNEEGYILSVAGFFSFYFVKYLDYDVPVDPKYWPLIFFVGGEAERDPITKEIISIEPGNIENNRQYELDEIILRAKSIGIWCVLIVNII